MKVLVTGGAGFIGSNFVHYILQNDPTWDLIVFDSLTYAGRIDNIPESVPLIHGDIAGPEVEQAIESFAPSLVVNFAAESHVDRSISNANDFVDTNIVGTFRIMEACRRIGATLLHVSTDEVYGSVPYGLSKEDAPLNPTNPYAASKASSDLMVLSYIKTHNFPAIITRCTNNYGPRQFPEKYIPLLITNAIRNRLLPVYGDGQQVRDWIYVEDHCSAIKAIVDAGRWGEVYNISAEQPITNNLVASRICTELNKSNSLVNYVPDRPAHDRRYALDASKLRNDLGWTPRFNFEHGLRLTVEWYRMNQRWWKSRV